MDRSTPTGRVASEPPSGSGTLLVLSQVYVPDPASVGQHMADAAAELVKRGHRVRVLTSARGYDDPSVRYPLREMIEGVEIRRLPLSSFGKGSIPLRVLAGLIFMVQTIVRGVFTPRLRAILVSTSPPMCSIAALVIAAIRRVPIKYWVMDLNPDQMIELGKAKPGSLAVRAFNALQRAILRRATDVIVLDRFMAERIDRKLDVRDKMEIMPPWPHDSHLESVPHDRNPFRMAHGLEGKFVVMYSGNHGFSTPVQTVLDAALELQHRDELVFMFIGGGVGKKDVDETIAHHKPMNVRSLPYQPLDQIRYSLSAADVHLVSVGDAVVGVVHPCKVYGAMAVARPILLLGPDPCHVSDIVRDNSIGWQIRHGDVKGAVETLEAILATNPAALAGMGAKAKSLVESTYSKELLCGRLCNAVERRLTPSRAHAARREGTEVSA